MNDDVAAPRAGRTTREARRASKRQAVLDASVRLFNERGFRSTSLDDVAASLEVTKPTIYRHFPSKDAVLLECVLLGLDLIQDAVEEATAKGSNGCDRLRRLIRQYALIKTRAFGICVSRTTDDQLSPESAVKFREHKRRINQLLQDVIADGVADGSLRAVDPRLTAFAIAGSLNWIAHWYRPDGQMTPDDIATGMEETLIQGLLP